MDITLERILSLLPHKENGELKHGAKKQFAVSLGFKDGTIFNDWLAGRSNTYTNYLYEIADKYNVSVDWLKGESDIKEKPVPDGNGLSEEDRQLIELFKKAPDELKRAALAVLRAAEEK